MGGSEPSRPAKDDPWASQIMEIVMSDMKANLDTWRQQMIYNNDNSLPHKFCLTLKVAQSLKVMQTQAVCLITTILDPGTYAFNWVFDKTRSIMTALEQSPPEQTQVFDQAICTSTGLGIIRIHIHVKFLRIKELENTPFRSSIVGYGYAAFPIKKELNYDRILEICNSMDVRKQTKNEIARRLWNIYMQTLDSSQLQNLIKLTHQENGVQDPFS